MSTKVQKQHNLCPCCGIDMGRYPDLCDPCWQLKQSLDWAKHSPKGYQAVLKYFKLKELNS